VFKLAKSEVSFRFAKISFGVNVKGQRNHTCRKGQPRELGKTTHNDH